MIITEFPHETFIKIENEPYFAGRITVNKLGDKFNAEIDIVNTETLKIYKHIDVLYNFSVAEEAHDNAIQKLSNVLKGQS